MIRLIFSLNPKQAHHIQTAKNIENTKMAKMVYMSLPFLSESHKTIASSSSSSSSKPLKLPHRTRSTNISISSSTNGNKQNKLHFYYNATDFYFIHAYLPKKLKLSGSANRSVKPQKFNSDISPHRAGIFIYLCFASM
jgi:hypothetical protein